MTACNPYRDVDSEPIADACVQPWEVKDIIRGLPSKAA